jgi:hypothetical protein
MGSHGGNQPGNGNGNGGGSVDPDPADEVDELPQAPPALHGEPSDGPDVRLDNLPRVVDPNAFDETTLVPFNFHRYPADRLVRRMVFVPVAAQITSPLRGDLEGHAQQLAVGLAAVTGQAPDPTRARVALDMAKLALQEANGDVAAAYLAMRSNDLAEAAALLQLLHQDVGYLFLDQIRLRPSRAVLGDLIYTLGLGPREKVTLTQKTWSKRQVSLEDMVSEIQEKSVEFSSAFSTEVGENTEHQQQAQSSWNLNATVGGSYGGVSGSLGYGTSASQSSTDSQQFMSKQSQQTTRKVTDTAKKEHRVTFKLETETGVEDVSQRLFENPNSTRTLMLSFYRVYQQFQVFHERWGARACWAPSVQDPGRDLRIKQKLLEEKWTKYLNDVQTWVPPDMPPAPTGATLNSAWSAKTPAGPGGYRGDIKTTIVIPDGSVLVTYDWEKDPGMTWGNVGWPYNHNNPGPGAKGTVDIWWHLGLAPCTFVACNEPWGLIRTVYTTSADSAAINAWNALLLERRTAELKKRSDEVDNERAQALKDLSDRANYDPWSELMRRVVAEHLTQNQYGSATEVSLWHNLFEWDAATFQLFPNWWSGHDATDAQSALTTFLNAQWARIFVPLRSGDEMKAFALLSRTTLTT